MLYHTWCHHFPGPTILMTRTSKLMTFTTTNIILYCYLCRRLVLRRKCDCKSIKDICNCKEKNRIFSDAHKIPDIAGKNAGWKNLYPRAESNRNRQNRNLKFYPLNYGGIALSDWQYQKRTAKIMNFPELYYLCAPKSTYKLLCQQQKETVSAAVSQ